MLQKEKTSLCVKKSQDVKHISLLLVEFILILFLKDFLNCLIFYVEFKIMQQHVIIL